MELVTKSQNIVKPNEYLSFVESELVDQDALLGKIKQIDGNLIPIVTNLAVNQIISSEHFNQFIASSAFNLTTLFSAYNRLLDSARSHQLTFDHYLSVFDKTATRITSRLAELRVQAKSDFTNTIAEEFDDETIGRLSSDGITSKLILRPVSILNVPTRIRDIESLTYPDIFEEEVLITRALFTASTTALNLNTGALSTATGTAGAPGIYFIRKFDDGEYVTGSDRTFETSNICNADINGQCARNFNQFYFANCKNLQCPGYEGKGHSNDGLYKIRTDSQVETGWIFAPPDPNETWMIRGKAQPLTLKYTVRLQTKNFINRLVAAINSPFPIVIEKLEYFNEENGIGNTEITDVGGSYSGYFQLDFPEVLTRELYLTVRLDTPRIVRKYHTEDKTNLASTLDINRPQIIENRIDPFTPYLQDDYQFPCKIENIRALLVEYDTEGSGKLRTVMAKRPKFLRIGLNLNKFFTQPEVTIFVTKNDYNSNDDLIDTYSFFYPLYQDFNSNTIETSINPRLDVNLNTKPGQYIVENTVRFPVLQHVLTYIAFENRYVNGFAEGADDDYVHIYKTPIEYQLIDGKVKFAQDMVQFSSFHNGERIERSTFVVEIAMKSNKASGWTTPQIDSVYMSIGETDV